MNLPKLKPNKFNTEVENETSGEVAFRRKHEITKEYFSKIINPTKNNIFIKAFLVVFGNYSPHDADMIYESLYNKKDIIYKDMDLFKIDEIILTGLSGSIINN